MAVADQEHADGLLADAARGWPAGWRTLNAPHLVTLVAEPGVVLHAGVWVERAADQQDTAA